MSTGPFGQPEYSGPAAPAGTQAEPSAPSHAPQAGSQEQGIEGDAGTQETAPSLTDIATLGKFMLDGKEMTLEQLRKERLMHSDYTKKAQTLSKEKKYWDNLDADLAAVRSRPALKDQFLSTYPKHFHKYLSSAITEASIEQDREAAQGQPQSSQLPPEVLTKLEQFENYVRDQETSKQEAHIEKIENAMLKKYPEAHLELVYSRAQVLADEGTKFTEATWEKLFKASHEAEVQRLKNKQKTTLEKQRTANLSAKDTAGGGTPGQAPQRVKFKDVAERAIQDLRSKGR